MTDRPPYASYAASTHDDDDNPAPELSTFLAASNASARAKAPMACPGLKPAYLRGAGLPCRGWNEPPLAC